MGQLTPGSSVSKARSRTPDCKTWTRFILRLIFTDNDFFFHDISKSNTYGCSSFRKMTVNDALYSAKSICPVPQLSWANREKFWEVMCRKDELSLKTRNADLFEYQQFLRPRMRVILLDWISEVSH